MSTSTPFAFVFPGQGSQSVGMLAALAGQHPAVREAFDEAGAGAGLELWAISHAGPEDLLNQTEYTQPALLAAGVGVWRAWQAAGGPEPLALAGHSLGEYSALVAAGVLSLGEAAHLVRLRGRYMQDAVPAGEGAMAAVIGAEDATVEAACAAVADAGTVVAANYNAPGQVVIGGTAAAVDAALGQLAAEGVRRTVRLAVSVPSHTPLMEPAARRLAEAMQACTWNPPQRPVVQNVDAAVHEDPSAIRDALVRQLSLPVRWTACVQALQERGATALVECGPGKVLAGLARRIDRSLAAHSTGMPDEFRQALAAVAGP